MKTPYDFKRYDPVIDKVRLIIRASRASPREVSEDSGVSYATICQLLRTAEDRGNRRYHSRGIKFATLARIVYGLKRTIGSLE